MPSWEDDPEHPARERRTGGGQTARSGPARRSRFRAQTAEPRRPPLHPEKPAKSCDRSGRTNPTTPGRTTSRRRSVRLAPAQPGRFGRLFFKRKEDELDPEPFQKQGVTKVGLLWWRGVGKSYLFPIHGVPDRRRSIRSNRLLLSAGAAVAIARFEYATR